MSTTDLNLRGGLMLTAEQSAQLHQHVAQLARQLNTTLILLAEQSGQTICCDMANVGARQVDTTALGSLAAGDLAASQAIAQQIGVVDEGHFILRQANTLNTLIVGAGAFVLLVLVGAQVPLGFARLMIQRTAAHLAEIQPVPCDTPLDWELGQTNLTQSLDEALDTLWTKD